MAPFKQSLRREFEFWKSFCVLIPESNQGRHCVIGVSSKTYLYVYAKSYAYLDSGFATYGSYEAHLQSFMCSCCFGHLELRCCVIPVIIRM